jgi:hypothetical protein
MKGAGALIVAHTCDEPTLQRLLSTGPHVRGGGVLVFQSPLPDAANDSLSDPVHRLLAASGYVVEQCHHGRRRELHIARRQPHACLKAA